jgi:hypothetical protein
VIWILHEWETEAAIAPTRPCTWTILVEGSFSAAPPAPDACATILYHPSVHVPNCVTVLHDELIFGLLMTHEFESA